MVHHSAYANHLVAAIAKHASKLQNIVFRCDDPRSNGISFWMFLFSHLRARETLRRQRETCAPQRKDPHLECILCATNRNFKAAHTLKIACHTDLVLHTECATLFNYRNSWDFWPKGNFTIIFTLPSRWSDARARGFFVRAYFPNDAQSWWCRARAMKTRRHAEKCRLAHSAATCCLYSDGEDLYNAEAAWMGRCVMALAVLWCVRSWSHRSCIYIHPQKESFSLSIEYLPKDMYLLFFLICFEVNCLLQIFILISFTLSNHCSHTFCM